ncbi:MAG: SDR family oxidoreductase [Rhodospirillaceae bacterium]|nr:SDR family oxidoreductase [Rhodospirillaceae bacterium]
MQCPSAGEPYRNFLAEPPTEVQRSNGRESAMTPNRVALVTGAAGGLGTAIAAGLAKAGFRLALLDRAPLPPAHPAFEVPGSGRIAETVDFADCGAVEDAVGRLADGLGEPAVLVNAAGLGPPFVDPGIFERPVDLTTVEADRWRRLFDVNVAGAFHAARAVAGPMIARGWGRIVNVTTNLDSMLRPGVASYGASKAALEALSAAWAAELAGTGVTVNVVIPGGPADTPMVPDLPGLDRASLVPAAAMAPPVAWLCSAAADAVTGRRLVASGWVDPPAGAAAETVGSPIGWPQLAGTDRTVPMAGTLDRPVRASGS